MLRVLALVLASFRGLAFRRVLAVMVSLCLVVGSLEASFAACVSDETAGAVSHPSASALMAVAGEPDAGAPDASVIEPAPAETQSPAKSQTSVLHDCHGCHVAVMPAHSASPGERLSVVSADVTEPSVLGRTVPTDLRPPRA